MHRDTILRIEDSLRATAEGSLKWLQGQRVPVPVVDGRVNINLFSSPKRSEGMDRERSGLKQAAVSKKDIQFTLPSFSSPFPSNTTHAHAHSTSDLITSETANSSAKMNFSTNNLKGTETNNYSSSKYSEPVDLTGLSLEAIPLPHRPSSMPSTPTSSPSLSLKKDAGIESEKSSADGESFHLSSPSFPLFPHTLSFFIPHFLLTLSFFIPHFFLTLSF